MTSKEFVIWLKGFITACNEYSPTPKQWDIIKEELEKVSDKEKLPELQQSPTPLPGTPIGPGWGVPNTAPIMPLPYYPNPLDNPFKVTCDATGSYGTITTTPGTGFITIANPNIASFGVGSTSTSYGYPSGSAWHYTNGGNDIKD